MKLTILALALSTYRCGASSRKLSAVAEAEEDYYYDGEVNTYYDGYADADDTAVRAPINVTLTYSDVGQLAAACGASRLDGGMHFTGAVAAGEKLCKGIGTAGFEYASDLIGGEW